MVFAWMDKCQYSNWLRRKQHGAKLLADAKHEKNPVQYTAASIRRLSERLLRRAKRQIRQSSRSCSNSPLVEDMQASDCPNFDFDDLDLESNLLKEESSNCVSKELSQDGTKDAAEKCNVHSNEHLSPPCTVNSVVVHKNVSFNADDAYNQADHIDLICDNEVSVILERGGMEKPVSTSKVLDGENKDAANAKTEQLLDVLSKDPATECKEMDAERSMTNDKGIGSIHAQDSVMGGFATKLLDNAMNEGQQCVNMGSQGNNSMASSRMDDYKIVGDEKRDEHHVAYSISDEEVIAVELNLSSLDQDVKEIQNEVKSVARSKEESSELAPKHTVTKEVEETVRSSCEEVTINDKGNNTQVGDSVFDNKDTSLSGTLGMEEAGTGIIVL